jgi:small conductance mechanosensitive channel
MDKPLNNFDVDFTQLSTMVMDLVITYGLKLVGSILFLIVGLWAAARIGKVLDKIMVRRNIDTSLRGFLSSFLSMMLKIVVIISVLGIAGVQMASFIAILGAASVAIALSLQGSLSNFAGGIIILLFKPFRVGDFIDGQGKMGTVEDIEIFHTTLKTPDNKVITVPNGGLANSSVTNFSKKETRRVEWTFGIGYGDSYEQARDVLRGLIDADSRIHQDPEPFIRLTSLGDSSVNIVVRVWLNAADYWEVFFDMNEKVYKAFAEAGINIPFPQMDVHLHKED